MKKLPVDDDDNAHRYMADYSNEIVSSAQTYYM